MKQSHSPGPWVPESGVMAKGINHFAITARHNGNDWMICSMTPMHLKREVDDANARLIASAPELLAALQVIVASIENGSVQGIKNDGCKFNLENSLLHIDAKAAIAKATGTNPTGNGELA